MSKPLKTLIAYSREDQQSKEKLVECLKEIEREGLIKYLGRQRDHRGRHMAR